MLLLLVLSLTIVSGVRSDQYACGSQSPACVSEDPIPDEAKRAHQESGNFLPSDEFFKKSCDPMVQNLECVRDYYVTCYNTTMDFDVLVHAVVEFCDEESDLRKGYVANVDCVNSIDFIGSCQDIFIYLFNSPSGSQEDLEEKNVKDECVFIHLVKLCVVRTIEKSCGEGAGQAANRFFDRAMDVFLCSESDADYFNKVFGFLL